MIKFNVMKKVIWLVINVLAVFEIVQAQHESIDIKPSNISNWTGYVDNSIPFGTKTDGTIKFGMEKYLTLDHVFRGWAVFNINGITTGSRIDYCEFKYDIINTSVLGIDGYLKLKKITLDPSTESDALLLWEFS